MAFSFPRQVNAVNTQTPVLCGINFQPDQAPGSGFHCLHHVAVPLFSERCLLSLMICINTSHIIHYTHSHQNILVCHTWSLIDANLNFRVLSLLGKRCHCDSVLYVPLNRTKMKDRNLDLTALFLSLHSVNRQLQKYSCTTECTQYYFLCLLQSYCKISHCANHLHPWTEQLVCKVHVSRSSIALFALIHCSSSTAVSGFAY